MTLGLVEQVYMLPRARYGRVFPEVGYQLAGPAFSLRSPILPRKPFAVMNPWTWELGDCRAANYKGRGGTSSLSSYWMGVGFSPGLAFIPSPTYGFTETSMVKDTDYTSNGLVDGGVGLPATFSPDYTSCVGFVIRTRRSLNAFTPGGSPSVTATIKIDGVTVLTVTVDPNDAVLRESYYSIPYPVDAARFTSRLTMSGPDNGAMTVGRVMLSRSGLWITPGPLSGGYVRNVAPPWFGPQSLCGVPALSDAMSGMQSIDTGARVLGQFDFQSPPTLAGASTPLSALNLGWPVRSGDDLVLVYRGLGGRGIGSAAEPGSPARVLLDDCGIVDVCSITVPDPPPPTPPYPPLSWQIRVGSDRRHNPGMRLSAFPFPPYTATYTVVTTIGTSSRPIGYASGSAGALKGGSFCWVGGPVRTPARTDDIYDASVSGRRTHTAPPLYDTALLTGEEPTDQDVIPGGIHAEMLAGVAIPISYVLPRSGTDGIFTVAVTDLPGGWFQGGGDVAILVVRLLGCPSGMFLVEARYTLVTSSGTTVSPWGGISAGASFSMEPSAGGLPDNKSYSSAGVREASVVANLKPAIPTEGSGSTPLAEDHITSWELRVRSIPLPTPTTLSVGSTALPRLTVTAPYEVPTAIPGFRLGAFTAGVAGSYRIKVVLQAATLGGRPSNFSSRMIVSVSRDASGFSRSDLNLTSPVGANLALAYPSTQGYFFHSALLTAVPTTAPSGVGKDPTTIIYPIPLNVDWTGTKWAGQGGNLAFVQVLRDVSPGTFTIPADAEWYFAPAPLDWFFFGAGSATWIRDGDSVVTPSGWRLIDTAVGAPVTVSVTLAASETIYVRVALGGGDCSMLGMLAPSWVGSFVDTTTTAAPITVTVTAPPP